VELIGERSDWWGPCWQAMGMAVSRGEGNGIRNLVNRGIVATKPGFSHDQVPTGKFSDLEG